MLLEPILELALLENYNFIPGISDGGKKTSEFDGRDELSRFCFSTVWSRLVQGPCGAIRNMQSSITITGQGHNHS
jgi:hypothetical protein